MMESTYVIIEVLRSSIGNLGGHFCTRLASKLSIMRKERLMWLIKPHQKLLTYRFEFVVMQTGNENLIINFYIGLFLIPPRNTDFPLIHDS